MSADYQATIEAFGPGGAIEREHLVALAVPEVHAVTVGEQGPAGRPGIPGPAGGVAVERLAGAPLSALRVVWEGASGDVYTLDYRDAGAVFQLLGVTLTAAGTGQAINVQRSGVLDDSAWSWQPGPIWLGVDGALTQVPPADGFCVLCGSAVSATRIILNVQTPIALE